YKDFEPYERGGRTAPDHSNAGLQIGAQHQSNGRASTSSRSLNLLYIKPIKTFTSGRGARITIAPKLFVYLGGLSDNPDWKRYRGFADLRVILADPTDFWEISFL